MSVRFLDPGPGDAHSVRKYDAYLKSGQSALKLGLVANGFPDSVAFLDVLETQLKSLFPGTDFVRYTKPKIGAVLDEAETLARFQDCSAIVLALGHCGSCTAATTRDAALCERLGIPAVLLVTEMFVNLSRGVAFSVGLTDIPTVILPHPTAGTSPSDMQQIAMTAAPRVIEQLCGVPA